MKASLFRTDLHYGGGLMLHTASSGNIASLDTLYLRLEADGIAGIGEVRINIAYLNGLAADTVAEEAASALRTIDWRRAPEDLLATMPEWAADYSAPIRMLLDNGLHDLCAKRAGTSVTAWLGGSAAGPIEHPTNQTLFWSPDVVLLAQASRYVERGFQDLKLRVGFGAIADDLRRLDLLRQTFGSRVEIAVDANGQWSVAEAQHHIDALARRDVRYVEQPIAAGDWAALERLVGTTPLPIMLDESLKSPADVARLCDLAGAAIAGHLKLVKLGGIAPTLIAAAKLRAVGIPFMIGQMNEGGGATAAALHVARIAAPDWAELYGADGLTDDPVSGIEYRDGRVAATDTPGLGVTFDAAQAGHLMSI